MPASQQERRRILVIPCHNVGPMGDQNRDDTNITVLGSSMERSFVGEILRVHICSLADQRLGDIPMTTLLQQSQGG